jgi:dienelactone hydrolase
MKNIFITAILIAFCQLKIFAGIGTTTVTVVDAARANRNIPCDVYYPSASNGLNVAISAGNFGVVVIGHGFFMGTDAYKYLGDSLSNAGYIVAVVNTETGLNKSISTFGNDLAAVADYFVAQNSITTSFFANHVKNKVIVLGHSMGGLAAFSCANASNNIIATVNLSAADSGGVAAAICSAIAKSNFSITGTIDCVAPPATNAKLMYDALKSNCKYYMNITGATHCGMADQNAICSFGEACIIGQSYISKPQQHRLILQPLYLYLDYHLNGNNAAFTAFENYISSADSFSFEKICGSLPIVQHLQSNQTYFYPNPATNLISFTNQFVVSNLKIINKFGQIVLEKIMLPNDNTVSITSLPAGIYFVNMQLQSGKHIIQKLEKR